MWFFSIFSLKFIYPTNIVCSLYRYERDTWILWYGLPQWLCRICSREIGNKPTDISLLFLQQNCFICVYPYFPAKERNVLLRLSSLYIEKTELYLQKTIDITCNTTKALKLDKSVLSGLDIVKQCLLNNITNRQTKSI